MYNCIFENGVVMQAGECPAEIEGVALVDAVDLSTTIEVTTPHPDRWPALGLVLLAVIGAAILSRSR